MLFAPYLITVAEQAAGGSTDRRTSSQDLSVSGSRSPPGSLPSYLVTFSTILSALVLPARWARCADRIGEQEAALAGFAWAGAGFALAAVLLPPASNWQIGAVAVFGANLSSARRWWSTTRSCR